MYSMGSHFDSPTPRPPAWKSGPSWAPAWASIPCDDTSATRSFRLAGGWQVSWGSARCRHHRRRCRRPCPAQAPRLPHVPASTQLMARHLLGRSLGLRGWRLCRGSLAPELGSALRLPGSPAPRLGLLLGLLAKPLVEGPIILLTCR